MWIIGCCNCVVISNKKIRLHIYPATTRLTDWYSLANQTAFDTLVVGKRLAWTLLLSA